MGCSKRIYYIDYYDNNGRIANVGFVKLIFRRKNGCCDEACLQICVSGILPQNKKCGEINLVSGVHSINLGAAELADGKGVLGVGDFDERLTDLAAISQEAVFLQIELKPEGRLVCKLKEAVRDNQEKEKREKSEEKVEERANIEIAEVKKINHPEKWRQLWEVFPHIYPFGDDREYMQLELKDMIVLPRTYYRLVENSFLLHGYYNYGHVILAKTHQRGQEKICLGVPGNYFEKEVQVAVMFGFESFESKTEPAGEGDFGYYFIKVDI